MNFIKFGHACIRLEQDGRALVIDPGSFSEAEAVDGATDVLVTHEHVDHYSEENLTRALDQNPALKIWTNPTVAHLLSGKGSRVQTVGHGDVFEAAGFDVRVFGEEHAQIHRDIPIVKNIGFLVDGKVFHPGDALTVPEQPVETLMLPAHAPWSKLGELVDYVREVKPSNTYAIHDGLLSELGLTFLASNLQRLTTAPYERLAPGESTHLH